MDDRPTDPNAGPETTDDRRQPIDWLVAALVNGLIIGVLAYALALRTYNSELYYLGLQEDEYLEWATFWGFVLAAGVFVVAAVRQRRSKGRLPWFLAGVALFCLFVAMEEVSWGQRLLGYRPPSYFLEHNFQQEFNVHNVWSTSLRKTGVKAVIGGYGIVLPLIMLVAPVRRLLERAAVVAPPAELIPSFAAAYIMYETYPWKFSGELVELMLGFCFLFAGVDGVRPVAGKSRSAGDSRPGLVSLAAVWALTVGLGLATAAIYRSQRAAHPDNLAAAQTETEALTQDFLALAKARGGRPVTKCGLHKRMYSYVKKYRQAYLLEGTFATLTAQGLPEERASFFLDPWNSPYWIRHKCSGNRQRREVFVYSFGPNRRRDSTQWEIRGDDVGTVILTEER